MNERLDERKWTCKYLAEFFERVASDKDHDAKSYASDKNWAKAAELGISAETWRAAAGELRNFGKTEEAA